MGWVHFIVLIFVDFQAKKEWAGGRAGVLHVCQLGRAGTHGWLLCLLSILLRPSPASRSSQASPAPCGPAASAGLRNKGQHSTLSTQLSNRAQKPALQRAQEAGKQARTHCSAAQLYMQACHPTGLWPQTTQKKKQHTGRVGRAGVDD